MKQKVRVGELLKTNVLIRVYRNILAFPAWFSPWKGFRRAFHKMRGTKIGKNVEIGYFVFIDNRYPELIEIEDNATITSKCTLLAHDLSMRFVDGTETVGKVKIGKGTFIGMNSIILPGVEIGENSIIGCGSIVTKNTKANSLYLGQPAVKISDLKTL